MAPTQGMSNSADGASSTMISNPTHTAATTARVVVMVREARRTNTERG